VLARIATVNLFNPILKARDFPVAQYGVVMSAMTVFEAIGSYWPGWLRKLMSDLNAVFLLTVTMAVSLGAVVYSGQLGTVAWLCVFSLAIGLSYPIQRQLMNDAIVDSRYRATLLSIESIIDRAFNAWVALLLAGQLAGRGLDRFLLASAIITLASVAVLPSLFIRYGGFSQANARALGGTSVLIVVGVALDTMRQMESQMMMRSYEGFLK
jgi:hypothetical protein